MTYKEPTDDTISAIENLFDGDRNSSFEFETRLDGYYITISQMYNYVSFKFGSVLQNYHKIAELLGVNDGGEINRNSYGGCETCDYGSKYTLELKFWQSE
jgi:hypothetical protein